MTTGCESLLQQCGIALVSSFGAVVVALVSLVKAHDSEKYVRKNLIEKEEGKK